MATPPVDGKISLNAYSHIIWDWNGTLFDDVWLCVDIMTGMLGRRNLPPLSRERYHELFDFPVRTYYQRLGFDFQAELFEDVSSEFITNYEKRRPECQLKQSAKAVLDFIGNSGISQSILSAREHRALQNDVAFYGLPDYFNEVRGIADHHAHGKIDTGRKLIDDIGEHPGGVLMIGDTAHDADVAQALGIDCCLVADGHHPRRRLEKTGRRVVSSLNQLISNP